MKFDLEKSLGFIVQRTALKMKNELNRVFKPYGITPEQWGLLNYLWQKDGIAQKELSNKSYKDQPSVTRLLDKLEEKGLIIRRLNPRDRRELLVFLSYRGRELKDELVPLAAGYLQKMQQGMSEKDLDLLKLLLTKVYINLDNKL